jgi:hypothetical protein
MNLVRSVWGFGSSKKYWRASLIAASTASDPVYRQHCACELDLWFMEGLPSLT